MVFYEAGSLKPLREVNILFNALFKSPALCILRKERGTLVAINNIWNLKGGQDVYGWVSHIIALACTERCVI